MAEKIEIIGNVMSGGKGDMFVFQNTGKHADWKVMFNSSFNTEGSLLRVTSDGNSIEDILESVGLPRETPRELLGEAIKQYIGSYGESAQQRESMLERSKLAAWLGNLANATTVYLAITKLVNNGWLNDVRSQLGL